MLRRCRICKTKKLKRIFSLGEQPLANNFLDSKEDKTVSYPLELYQCSHCSLIQLGHIVPKEKMYDEYFYIPSVSQTHLEHFDTIAKTLIEELQLKKKSLVVDIGSSDGSLLTCFRKRGMSVTGIEPAQNIETDIPTYRFYFNKRLANLIVTLEGKAKLVTATNVFAHINNLDNFLQALDILLDEDGVFFAQFPDVRNLLKENQFDTIYHEHLSYFTYEPLHHLFANSPFELYKVDNSNIHGGSMRIYVRRRKPLFTGFIKNVKEIKHTLYQTITNYKAQGLKVVGFGAAAKGTVLLNYCKLDYKLIDYVADGTSYKQGKYIPGVNIPIVPEERLLEDKPDVVLILAWNFKEEIMEKLKGKGFIFIVPIPKVQIYENSNS